MTVCLVAKIGCGWQRILYHKPHVFIPEQVQLHLFLKIMAFAFIKIMVWAPNKSILFFLIPLIGKYIGEFDDHHIRNGFGIYYWPSGRKYEGKNGLPFSCFFFLIDSINLLGEWKHGSMAGYGIETSGDGQYNGEWKDGLYHGKGVYTWISDGQVYGDFL